MFPFTPLRTYVARSVPVIEALVLTAWQYFFVDLSTRVVRQRPRGYLHSHDGAALQLEYLRGVFVVDSVTGGWVAVEVPEPTTTLTVGDVLPAVVSFSADTWYYIYVRSASRIPFFVISETAPSTDRFFGPDTTYRYVGCFYANTAGDVIPFSERDGRFQFTGGRPGDNVVSPIVSSTTLQNLNTAYLPPGIRRATFRVYMTNSNTAANDTLSLLPGGVSGTIVSPGTYGRQLICPAAPSMGVLAEVDTRIEMEVAEGPTQLQGKVLAGGGASGALLSVEGFEDWS